MAKAAENIKTTKIKGKKERYYLTDLKSNWQLYAMVLLPLIWIIMFRYMPMYGVQIAFKNYTPTKGIIGSEWAGFKHFIRFLKSSQFLMITKNTLAISIYQIALTVTLPIILAIGLNYIRHNRFKKTVQMVSYLPHFISVVIIVSMVNLIFNTQSGIVNNVIFALTGKKVNILGLSKYFRHLFVWSGVWQSNGWNSILYIAALAGVDPQLHEAAKIDGANKWKRIYHVDIPSIIPTIAIMTIMSMGSILSVSFDKAFLMQNTTNLKISEVFSTYEYKTGVGGGVANYSYSSAIGLMASGVTFVLIIITNKISKKLSDTGLW